MSEKQIYLIRHGETDWNVQKRWQGGDADIEMNSHGTIQAMRSGIYLNEYQQKDKRFDLIISSPLSRAKLTAQIIAGKLNYPLDKIIYDDNLVEKYKNKICGRTEKDLAELPEFKLYNDLNKEWNQILDPIEKMNKLPELEEKLSNIFGVESHEAVAKRIEIVKNRIISCDATKILVVTHGGIISSWMKLLFNLHWDIPRGRLLDEGNCCISLMIYKNNTFHLRSAYTNQHLEFIKIPLKDKNGQIVYF